jgi:nucleotide-binding universal stress UspA family protein
VVGTDFSDGAQDALQRALHLAEDSGARVALVHAYEETAGENLEDDLPFFVEWR